MKKWRLFAGILAALLLISLGMNVRHYAEQAAARHSMIVALTNYLNMAAHGLDARLRDMDNLPPESRETPEELRYIGECYVRLDTLLTQYSYAHPGEQLRYSPAYNFAFIAHSLGGTNMADSGVMRDDVISDNELRYLEALRDDTFAMIDRLWQGTPKDQYPNPSIAQINTTLNDFFDVWTRYNEGSPYHLLLD